MVEVTTLDALLDQHPLDSVDLIKIDTEGQEAEVLNGMRRTLERFTPNMLVEVLDEKAERAVLQITNQYGYEYIWIDEAVGRVREAVGPSVAEHAVPPTGEVTMGRYSWWHRRWGNR